MKKKSKRIKKRNGFAKALESKSHAHKVIPDKRKKKIIKNIENEYDYLRNPIIQIWNDLHFMY